jgi:glucan 1,3-beta-glucosidase
MDSHPYLCFGTQSDAPMSSYINTPCTNWAGNVNKSMSDFGLTTAGEWSNAVTDCGLWVTGVDQGTRYEGDYVLGSFPRIGSCEPWTDYQNWTPAFKADMKSFALSSMDALQVHFFVEFD